jgi:quercetin dioxygenase-like cupin family protein
MTMLEKPLVSEFSHVKPGETPWRSHGLRDFFLYRDLGVAGATGGRVIAQLVKANEAPEKGTGWHRHEAEFHVVFMTKGWAKFMYENEEHLVSAGDCVHQRPGIQHYLFDYSPDMEYWKSSARRISARWIWRPDPLRCPCQDPGRKCSD